MTGTTLGSVVISVDSCNNQAGATITGSRAERDRYRHGWSVGGVVINSGTISGRPPRRCFIVVNGTVTNNSGGTISGGNIGVDVRNLGPLQRPSNPAVSNDGTITGGTFAVRFFGGGGDFLGELTNNGLLSATGASGVAVSFGRSGAAANSGRIEAAGADGIAIQAVDTVTVDNSSGIITARASASRLRRQSSTMTASSKPRE